MRKNIVIITLIAALWAVVCHGQSYEQMSRMDIKSLVDLGTRRLVEQNKPEEALRLSALPWADTVAALAMRTNSSV